MSMPTNCLDCPACNEYLTCAIPINGRKWEAKDVCEFDRGRPEWCPMEEEETASTAESRLFHCEKCGYGIDDIFLSNEHDFDVYPHYCPNCGRKVKW